jgi:hypothetical protein
MALHLRQHFLQQKSGEPVIEAIELEAPIEPRVVRRTGRGNISGRNANADRDRHRMLGNQVVENGSGVKAETIQTNVDASRFVPLVCGRDVNRDGPRGAGKDFGIRELEREGLSRGNRGVGL